MPSRLTTQEFVERSIKLHETRFDYDQASYSGFNAKVIIVCPEHGAFEQIAKTHLAGSACPSCSPKARMTTDGFVQRARAVHGDKYDYRETTVQDSCTKVTIECPRHGAFLQT